MQTVSTIFLIVFFAAFAGIIKPYIGNLTRWQFAVAALVSAMICGATAPVPTEVPDDTKVAKAEPPEGKIEQVEEEPTKQAKALPPSAPKPSPAPTRRKPSNDDESEASPERSTQHNIVIMSRDGVRSRLKDPDSAEFRNVGYYSGGPEGAAVCGEVNAKNSFGGFAGYERFVAMGPKTAFLESEVATGEFATVWNTLCVKAKTDEVQIP